MRMTIAHRLGLAPALRRQTADALVVLSACASHEVLTGVAPTLGELLGFLEAEEDWHPGRVYSARGFARGEGWIAVGGHTVTPAGWAEIGVPALGGAGNANAERKVG